MSDCRVIMECLWCGRELIVSDFGVIVEYLLSDRGEIA